MHWHHIDHRELFIKLKTHRSGLSDAEVVERRKMYGWNELPEIRKKHWFLILLKQFKSLLVLILFVAAMISIATGHAVDMWVILAVIVVNAIIGFVQELKAEKAVASLKSMLVPQAKVIRNGISQNITARELVPGDIIILEEGDSIPADARIIESKNLRAIEASLTGESVPINKREDSLPEETLLADRKNMVFKSTFIAAGYALAVVTGIGLQTAIGDIARSLGDIKTVKTNFQRKVETLARQMAVISILSASLLFIISYFFQQAKFEEILLISIAALVSAIPEGLPAVLSIVLAIGANRMTKRNAIIREFTATESLGAVTTIITDKTGTLTQNTLTVRNVFIPFEGEWQVSGEGWSPVGHFTHLGTVIDITQYPLLRQSLEIAAVCNNAQVNHNKTKDLYELVGDPTEGALHVLARKANIDTTHVLKTDDLPFNADIKMRASAVQHKGGKYYYIVGAPEKVLDKTSHIDSGDGLKPIDDELKTELRTKIEEWSGQAMRVIALAWKQSHTEHIVEHDIDQLVLAGLVGMIDPPRPDVLESVLACQGAGIRVIMATGDHINTAIAVAKATGIVEAQDSSKNIALTEQQLLLLDEQEFEKAISTINVFARLTPAMKLRIASTLQHKGELIAMTGDGVNDAPALKKADVGVAMGIMGTDVARDAAKVVLADDNFSTIVSAVEQGRIVFNNARQTAFFLITTNFAEIITLLTSIIIGLPIPLTATQILWLNLVTDGVGDIALATEEGHGDILKQKPINPKENILNKDILPFLLMNALVMTALALTAFQYYLPDGENKARSAAFIIMAFSQLYNIFNMRSLKLSVFSIGLFSNKYINIALVVSVVIQIMLVEVPFFEKLFQFDYIPPTEFLVLGLSSSLVLWFGELYKMYRRRFQRN